MIKRKNDFVLSVLFLALGAMYTKILIYISPLFYVASLLMSVRKNGLKSIIITLMNIIGIIYVLFTIFQ